MGINTTISGDVNFCLDENFIEITKNDASVNILKMFLKITNINETFRTQTYEYVFFDEKIKIYPGEIIENFLPDLDLSNFVNDTETLEPYRLRFLNSVNIRLEQYANDTLIDEESISSFFISGKRPKALPFLTNGTVRRTYRNSYISLSVLKYDEHLQLDELLNTSLSSKLGFNVINTAFVCKDLYAETEDAQIITKENLSLQPTPDAQAVINVIFQNQNKCPDWFSFSGEWEEHCDINNIISDKVDSGNVFKVSATEERTLKLNTGWFFEEEIDVLKELIMSPICYVYIRDKWQKVIPVTKKVLPFDNLRNINSQIIEFKIVEDER